MKAVGGLLEGTYLRSLRCLVALASVHRRVAPTLHECIRIRLVRDIAHVMRLIRVQKRLLTIKPVAVE